MFDIHRYIGEGLFLVYVIVIAVVLLMSRRGGSAPGWLMGIAHGLLAIQVAIGMILLADDSYSAPWYHWILGLSAIVALGLTPVFKQRLAGIYGVIAPLAVVAVLTLLARLAVL